MPTFTRGFGSVSAQAVAGFERRVGVRLPAEYKRFLRTTNGGEPEPKVFTVPAELGRPFGTGLLQLFYCTRGECQGYGGWGAFADDLSRVRVVHPAGGGGPPVPPDPAFPAKRIVGWEQFTDLPSPEEHRELGLEYVYDHKAGTVRLECEELGLVSETVRDPHLAENVANSSLGDKLGGWPAWVQGVEYPSCPRCGRRMAHVFQVDSEHNVPFMFGDAGCGHVTQCPEHKDVVAFGWACF